MLDGFNRMTPGLNFKNINVFIYHLQPKMAWRPQIIAIGISKIPDRIIPVRQCKFMFAFITKLTEIGIRFSDVLAQNQGRDWVYWGMLVKPRH